MPEPFTPPPLAAPATGTASQQIVEVYATLAGQVSEEMSRRFFAKAAPLINARIETVHLLVQSVGGYIGDGVGIYNFLRGLPIKLITYNGGQVSSAAVLIYLAGQVRNASQTATFVLHRSHASPTAMTTADRLKAGAQSLMIDDSRTESILRQHVDLSPEQWQIRERGDLTLSAEEAMRTGLASAVCDFVVPKGAVLINVMD